jgi:hypothetical protein
VSNRLKLLKRAAELARFIPSASTKYAHPTKCCRSRRQTQPIEAFGQFMPKYAPARVRALWGFRMAVDWIERHIAERLREHEERVRQRELKKNTRATRWAKIVEERER